MVNNSLRSTTKEAYFEKKYPLPEFDLGQYIYSLTGEKTKQVVHITRDELTRFYACVIPFLNTFIANGIRKVLKQALFLDRRMPY